MFSFVLLQCRAVQEEFLQETVPESSPGADQRISDYESSSMGRLTLNALLSFAQFEREVTGERI